MNSSGGKTPSTARPPAYKANALAMIRNELSQFANSGESSSSGQQSPQPPQNQQVSDSTDLSVCRWFSLSNILPHSRRFNHKTTIAKWTWYVKCSLKLVWLDLKWVKVFTFHYQTQVANDFRNVLLRFSHSFKNRNSTESGSCKKSVLVICERGRERKTRGKKLWN